MSLEVTDNYLTKTLLCKNNCGYYGNSIQYDGYCSICYRKLKSRSNKSNKKINHVHHGMFNDNSSLIGSQSFNSQFDFDDKSENDHRKNHQIWNDSNLNKFQKKESRRSGTNAIKQFLRRPSSHAIVETVSKVADKAANMVDQSILNNSINENSVTNTLTSSLSSIASLNSYLNYHDTNLVEFNSCLNKLVTPPSTTSASTSTANFNNEKESKTILSEFEYQFRGNFPQLYQDLFKQMRQFLEKFIDAIKRNDKLVMNSMKQNEIVQDFFKKIHKYILSNASIKAYLEKAALQQEKQNAEESTQKQPGEDAEKLNEGIMIMVESHVTNYIYDYVFPVIMSEFEDQDMNLQKRIRDFYWVTNEMIGTCIDENSIFYRDSYEEALNYIVEMDSKRTAHEKMMCITECSKNIYKAINISANITRNIDEASEFTSTSPGDGSEVKSKSKKSGKSIASADDYLPAFIYIVLKANPTMLYSNMNFISRFAFEKRVLQGEHAYHFCSLNAIINHIEHLNAHHLNMSEERFENYCIGLEDSTSNALKLIQSNLKILGELKDKQRLLNQETKKLQMDMNEFKKIMEKKFHSCLDNNKLTYTQKIAGYERKSVLDDTILDNTTLPQPLKPSSITLDKKENES